MLLLASTSDLVRVITDATSDIEVHASWVDNNAGTITPGRTNTASITTATTTTVVASPAASTQRNVRHLNIRNNHATVACNVTVDHTDGTNAEELITVNLLAGETLSFDQTGRWTHYDTNGGEYPAVLPVATQTEMEAATSIVKTVTPGMQQYHPSAAKFWAQVTGAGTPALVSSYNVTSIADTGPGRMTITIATDFSSADWCCGATTFTSTTTGDESICNIDAKAAGTVEIGSRIITPVFGDPIVGYDVFGFGDQ